MRSTEAEIPTPAYEQILREAGKSLRELREIDRIIRPKTARWTGERRV
jgi:hypothetical protein